MKNEEMSIPRGWQAIKLADLATVKKGEQLNRIELTDFGIGKYPALNGGISPSGYTDNWNVESDTITISEGGNSCGFVNFNKERFWCGGHCYALKNVKENIVKGFLYQSLKSRQDELMRLRVGSGLPNIQKKSIENFSLIVPSFAEQKMIAEILTSVDDEIRKTDEIISQTEKLKKGLMQNLFTKGIGHKKFKKTKIGDVPEGWIVKIFEEFAVLQRGFDLPTKERTSGKYPLVTSNGITSSHDIAMVGAPGVVTGRSGTLGNVFYIESDFWPLNTTLYVKDFQGNYEKFVYYKMQSFDLIRFGTGTGVPTLNRNIVHKELIAVPDYFEQKKIADILSDVDYKIIVNKKFNEKLIELKKGLMQDLISGIKRVEI